MIPRAHLKTQQGARRPEGGSATFLALFMLALLSFIGATVLMNVTRLYNGNEKVQGWQEALQAAEAGADIGLTNLRWTVTSGSTPFATPAPSPSPSLGWTATTCVANDSKPLCLQLSPGKPDTIYSYTTPVISQAGEGTVETWAVVTVDSPIGDNTTSPPQGLTDQNLKQWYRIRSTGHARLSGLSRVSNDSLSDSNARHTNALRKFSLRSQYDRISGTVTALSVPEATRTVEQIVQPKNLIAAVLAKTTLDMSGNAAIDSYDSSDPTKSTNGRYDPAKRQTNGGVVYMGTSSKGIAISSGEKIYGNVATNGANQSPAWAFTDPTNTIQPPGQIYNDSSINLPSWPVPKWGTAGNHAINNSFATVSKTPVTITIDSDPEKNYYKLVDINNALTVALASGVTTGTLNIWLTNGATTSGSIVIPAGATVIIYFTGDTFHPRNDTGILNYNYDPSTFQIYGCGGPPGDPNYDPNYQGGGPGIDIHVGASATANFYGTVYAPYRTLNLKYDAKAPNTYGFYGSFAGGNINLDGPVHYDEVGIGSGPVVDYIRASYVEDPR